MEYSQQLSLPPTAKEEEEARHSWQDSSTAVSPELPSDTVLKHCGRMCLRDFPQDLLERGSGAQGRPTAFPGLSTDRRHLPPSFPRHLCSSTQDSNNPVCHSKASLIHKCTHSLIRFGLLHLLHTGHCLDDCLLVFLGHPHPSLFSVLLCLQGLS